ncbi:MAG TPA: periplasmic heavy metal sensor [Candidatus Acidoferrales bacterium]|nr:periplasmic heavy metal sensor [Candidatus Acidoferrales bacterium]
MKRFAVAVALFAALLPGAPLAAEEAKDFGPESWEGLKEKLQLTSEQLLRLREIRARNVAEIAKLKKKLDQRIAELREMLDQDPPDHQRIEMAVQEIGRIQTDKVRLQTQSIFEIRSLLNPEQKRMLKAYRRGRKEGSLLWPAMTLEKFS